MAASLPPYSDSNPLQFVQYSRQWSELTEEAVILQVLVRSVNNVSGGIFRRRNTYADGDCAVLAERLLESLSLRYQGMSQHGTRLRTTFDVSMLIRLISEMLRCCITVRSSPSKPAG